MKKHAVKFINENKILVDGSYLSPEITKGIETFADVFMYGHNGYAAKQMAFATLLILYGEEYAKLKYLEFLERVISKATKPEILFTIDKEIFFIEKEL